MIAVGHTLAQSQNVVTVPNISGSSLLLGLWKTHCSLKTDLEGRSKLVCVKAEIVGLLGTTE